ncbi:hypothetical protein [Helicobacter cetorum]|uniref:hypothetical protein n=1 Tax=Helicobacter cetorum TaxID=138563 RepID=UPI001315A06F|nr:hypothetical protein [Helicobacter cetorum]
MRFILRHYSTIKDAPKDLGAKAQRSILNSNLNPKKEKLKYNERQGLLRGFAMRYPFIREYAPNLNEKGRDEILLQKFKISLKIQSWHVLKGNKNDFQRNSNSANFFEKVPTLKNPQKMGETFQRFIFKTTFNPNKQNLKYNERQGFLPCLCMINSLVVGIRPSKKLGRDNILSKNLKTSLKIRFFQTLENQETPFLNALKAFKRQQEILTPKQSILSVLKHRGLA